MSKSRYQLQISKDCRRSKAKQTAVLKWIQSQKRFSQDGRKPTVEEFIKEALKPGTVLYKADVLEHDTVKAASEYYRNEAQYYLRHIQVFRVSVSTRKATPPVRAYIPVKFSSRGRIREEDYKTAKRVANNPSLKLTVLEKAYKDLMAWADRYSDYSEFLEEFSDVLTAINKLSKFKKSA